MTNQFVVYVDFDKTLYDTEAFSQDLCTVIARKANLPLSKVEQDKHSFFSDPVLGGYDYEAHIVSYGLDPTMMWQALETLVQQNNYLYAESTDFITSLRDDGYEPRILSFGEKRFQLTKIQAVLPYLRSAQSKKDLEVTVVDSKKHEHIRRLHPGQRGVLVDDIPDQDLPEGFFEIHIDHARTQAQPIEKEGGYVVSSLAQARDIIHRLA